MWWPFTIPSHCTEQWQAPPLACTPTPRKQMVSQDPPASTGKGQLMRAPLAEVWLIHTAYGMRAGAWSLGVRKSRIAQVFVKGQSVVVEGCWAWGSEGTSGVSQTPGQAKPTRSKGSAKPGYYCVHCESWSWGHRPTYGDTYVNMPVQNSGCQGGALRHSNSNQYLVSTFHGL